LRLKALDVESQLNTFGSRLRVGKRDLDEIESDMQERLCHFNGDLSDNETVINSLCKSKVHLYSNISYCCFLVSMPFIYCGRLLN